MSQVSHHFTLSWYVLKSAAKGGRCKKHYAPEFSMIFFNAILCEREAVNPPFSFPLKGRFLLVFSL